MVTGLAGKGNSWIINAMHWYLVLLGGGFILLLASIGWLWSEIMGLFINEKRIYKTMHPLVSIFLLLFAIGISLVFYCLNITLVIPILMGIIAIFVPFGENETKRHNITRNASNYYDGILYAIIAEPLSKEPIDRISAYIPEKSKIIDICCGTGALALRLAEKCESVTGIDHSNGMLQYADRQRQKLGIKNTQFGHANAKNLPFGDKSFDYAVISMAIHEMPYETGIRALREAKRIAHHVVICDYKIPQPLNAAGLVSEYLEVLAGINHLRGYLKYNRHSGLDELLGKAELGIEEQTTISEGTMRIVKCKA